MKTSQSNTENNNSSAIEKQASSAVARQADTIKSVSWKSHAVQTNTLWTADAGLSETDITITLNGTITVVLAATALFTTFVLSGITFNLVNPGGAGTTSFNFTYNGSQSAAWIQSLLVAGANITFG